MRWIGKRTAKRKWKTPSTALAWVRWSTIRPTWGALSKPHYDMVRSRRSSSPTGHPGRHDRPVIVARTSVGSTVTVPVKVGAGGVTGGPVVGGFVPGGAVGSVGGNE